jgi:ribosomal protein S18 acetylase RimI-like enzyme
MIGEGYDSRILDGNDSSELFSLHRMIIETLPDPDLYLAKPLEYFKARLDGDLARSSAILGAFFEGKLIAYSSVRVRPYSSSSPDFPIVPKPCWQDTMIALMEDAAVHPHHRGHRIQALLMRAKTSIARQRGVVLDVSLVNVKNLPSLRTLLGEKFVAIGTTTVANGVSRLVLARPIEVLPKDPLPAAQHGTSDWNKIQTMLARGYVAVGLRQTASSANTAALIFARPSV